MTTETRLAKSSTHRPRKRLYGVVLLIAAGLAIVLPLPYRALQSVGTQDGAHLTAAGYESRRVVLRLPSAEIEKGGRLLSVVSDLHESATLNHIGAMRLEVALLLGLPGAFLLGRYPKSE